MSLARNDFEARNAQLTKAWLLENRYRMIGDVWSVCEAGIDDGFESEILLKLVILGMEAEVVEPFDKGEKHD